MPIGWLLRSLSFIIINIKNSSKHVYRHLNYANSCTIRSGYRLQSKMTKKDKIKELD